MSQQLTQTSTQTFDLSTRREAPLRADEVTALRGFLDYHRDTFRGKCAGLTQEQLAQAHPPSTMTLGGMMKHLALNEVGWFGQSLTGTPYPPPFDAVDWEADPDWEWRTAADDSPEALMELWEACVQRSRAHVAAAYADGGPEVLTGTSWPSGRPTLRRLMVDIIEEYARHTGHADLIRESIDGLVGEGMPQ